MMASLRRLVLPSLRLISARPTLFGARPTILQSTAGRFASSFENPSPLRLPAEQQAEFERLQHLANQAPADADPAAGVKSSTATPAAQPDNPALRKGAPPEFDGEKNPSTGEVGGPKNEPLRWGSAGDWSYNGRVTDF